MLPFTKPQKKRSRGCDRSSALIGQETGPCVLSIFQAVAHPEMLSSTNCNKMVTVLLKEYTVRRDGLQMGHSHSCSMNGYVTRATAAFAKEKGPWTFVFKHAAQHSLLAKFLRFPYRHEHSCCAHITLFTLPHRWNAASSMTVRQETSVSSSLSRSKNEVVTEGSCFSHGPLVSRV
jgi:hypothetical protein